MLEITAALSNSSLWQSTLNQRPGDAHADGRERLRASFLHFRERAAHLATEIRRDVPDLTIHDITHLDALWEVGSQIAGSGFPLTATEGYVLGGAILLHDLATSVAATPGGFEAIRRNPRYLDLIHAEHHERFGRSPTQEELDDPEAEIRRSVLFNLLRSLHAENAERLAFVSYPGSDGAPLFLIEDAELRQTFGRTIGKVAHSHWWSISDVETHFTRTIGAPHWAPSDWTIDPLKIACILRTADAAHIDARRAPKFVRAFSQIRETSKSHWIFQENLNKPYLRDDALVFTSGHAFHLSEADAWWTCLDALKMVDRELRSVDALLADKSDRRFAAKRVAGVDSPERLATYVQTVDWFPINATVHVSDLPHIIRSIGGEELYGKNPSVPLRELLQNASDAVRVRRIHEHRSADFGQIHVSLRTEGAIHTLEVADNGVGMSRRVLTDILLDFGRSLWNSPLAQEELPGLLSSGFRATGRYGIGFFSVFMISDSVKVITRRADAATRDTLVLEFGSGLKGRPILRPAEPQEQLRDGGTIVSLLLTRDPSVKGGLLFSRDEDDVITLGRLCSQTALALDVDVVVHHAGSDNTVVRANDWLTVSGDTFLQRLTARATGISARVRTEFRKRAARNLRPLVADNGETLGRACITAGNATFTADHPDISGMVAVGGLASCGLSGICGVLLGQSMKASRDDADPFVSRGSLKRWAEGQLELIPQLYSSTEGQSSCAQIVRLCGGHTGSLPIAINCGKWMSARDIEQMKLPTTIIVMDDFALEYEFKHLDDLMLDSNVFVTGVTGVPAILYQHGSYSREGNLFFGTESGLPRGFSSLVGAVIEAAAIAWGTTIGELLSCNKFDGFKNYYEMRVGASPSKGVVSTEAMRVERNA